VSFFLSPWQSNCQKWCRNLPPESLTQRFLLCLTWPSRLWGQSHSRLTLSQSRNDLSALLLSHTRAQHNIMIHPGVRCEVVTPRVARSATELSFDSQFGQKLDLSLRSRLFRISALSNKGRPVELPSLSEHTGASRKSNDPDPPWKRLK